MSIFAIFVYQVLQAVAMSMLKSQKYYKSNSLDPKDQRMDNSGPLTVLIGNYL